MDRSLFGQWLDEIVELAKKSMQEEYIGEWLVRPIPALDNLSVIEHLWKFGKKGYDDVVNLLNGLIFGTIS